jgi:flagella basal body P-ring formation protein FlgA
MAQLRRKRRNGIRPQGADATLILHALLLLGALLFCLVGWSDSLVLKDEVFVKGPKVLLGDLVEIHGETIQGLADIEVTSAALPGAYKQINASLISSRIRSAGHKLDDFSLEGSSQVRANTLATEVSRHAIGESLRQFIQQEMPWEPTQTDIDIPDLNQDYMVPDGRLEITWRANPQYRYLGHGTFRCGLRVDGEIRKTFYMKANVESYGTVLLAANDITRGQFLSVNDLETRRQARSAMPAGALTDPKGVVGLLATKTLYSGQVLTRRHVEARKLIKRNQLVPVELKSGTLKVRSQAKALMDARAGDILVCANPRTREQFQGIVRSDGVVEVQ